MTKAWYDNDGRCLKLTSDDVEVVDGAAGFTFDAPESGRMVWNGAAWVEAEPYAGLSLPDAKDAARDALAAKRYEIETGGITVNGTPVKTDRETQAILTAARTRALEDANFSVDWKVSNGVFVTLDAATIIAIANAVADHVQACFSNEKALDAQITAAADVAAVRAVDLESGW